MIALAHDVGYVLAVGGWLAMAPPFPDEVMAMAVEVGDRVAADSTAEKVEAVGGLTGLWSQALLFLVAKHLPPRQIVFGPKVVGVTHLRWITRN
jgi:hypothetical protein